jgi:hypothetical protein
MTHQVFMGHMTGAYCGSDSSVASSIEQDVDGEDSPADEDEDNPTQAQLQALRQRNIQALVDNRYYCISKWSACNFILRKLSDLHGLYCSHVMYPQTMPSIDMHHSMGAADTRKQSQSHLVYMHFSYPAHIAGWKRNGGRC